MVNDGEYVVRPYCGWKTLSEKNAGNIGYVYGLWMSMEILKHHKTVRLRNPAPSDG